MKTIVRSTEGYSGPQCQDNFLFNLRVISWIFHSWECSEFCVIGYASEFASSTSGSGSQALRMGTSNTARRKGLASAGAGFLEEFLTPPASTDFHHNIFLLASALQDSGEVVHGYKNQSISSGTCAVAQRI